MILIIDDDPGIRGLLTVVLNRKGFECAVAIDGAEAQKLLRVHDYDAILLDLMLPQLNGFEVLRFLKAERRAMLELAEGIAKKLLHNPQVALKKGGGDPVDGAILLSAVHRLFNLEVADAPVAAAGAEEDGDTNARGTGKATGS